MAECLTIENYCKLLGKINTTTASDYITKLKSIEGKIDKIQISWETTFKITQATTKSKATIEQNSTISNIKITSGVTVSDIGDNYVTVIPAIDCNACEKLLTLVDTSYFNAKELVERQQETCAKESIPILKTLQGSADAKIEPYSVTIPNPYIFPKSAVLLHGDYILGKAELTSSPTGCAKKENLKRSEQGGVVTIKYTAELPIKYGVCVKHLIENLLTEIAIKQEFTDEGGKICILLSPGKVDESYPFRNWSNETGIATPLYFLGGYLCGDDTGEKINEIITKLVDEQNTDPKIDENTKTIYVDTYYTLRNDPYNYSINSAFEKIDLKDYQESLAKGEAGGIPEYIAVRHPDRTYWVNCYIDDSESSTYTDGIFKYDLACTEIDTTSTNCSKSRPSNLHFKIYSPFTVEYGSEAIRVRTKENIYKTFSINVTSYGSE